MSRYARIALGIR
ncbi:Putative uncharacterized protein [Lactococcus lactis subsp. lactis A12]|nr:Putative uncharacterized protein [Lactococcus lactis subsp. lactis A12]SBW30107.1 Hypothetical protein LLA12_00954 [Lactococcus lactis subsp. lactis]